MVILQKDTFTDTNGVLLKDHVPDIGSLWTTSGSSTIAIQGNQAQSYTAASATFLAPISDGGLDCYAELKLVTPEIVAENAFTYDYVFVRRSGYSFPSNYGVTIQPKVNLVSHVKWVEIYNNNVLIQTITPYTVSPGDVIRIEVSGGPVNANINAKVNGVSIWTGVATVGASGYGGFVFGGIGGDRSYVDNFEYGTVDPPVPPISPSGLTASCAAPTGESVLSDAPTASFTADVQTGNAPLTVNFTDTSGNTPISWLWNFGDGSTSTSQNPTHIFENEGVYVVSLTATNATGSREYLMVISVTAAATVVPPGSDTVIPADVGAILGRIAFYAVDTDNNIVKGVSNSGSVVLSFGSLGTENGQFFRPTTCSVVNGRQRLDRIEIIEE